ncbi:MAG: hypothetical protein RL264_2376, partial [Bacteroidota bacterium]
SLNACWLKTKLILKQIAKQTKMLIFIIKHNKRYIHLFIEPIFGLYYKLVYFWFIKQTKWKIQHNKIWN